MPDAPRPLDVCVVASATDHVASPLVDAVRRLDPTARLHAVWAGDPHRRPPLPGALRWADLELDEPTGVGWERLLVACGDAAAGWARAARAGTRLLDRGAERLVVLRIGSAAVCGPVGEWVADRGVTVIERAPLGLPADGFAPGAADLAARGRWSPAVIGVAADAGHVLAELGDLVTAASASDDLGALFGAVLSRRTELLSSPPTGVAVGWSATTVDPIVLDVDDLDRDAGWHVDFGAIPPRQRLSADRRLADAVAGSVAQWRCGVDPVVLPGGVAVDPTIRHLVREAIAAWQRGDGELPPDPFASAGFVDWLESGSARSGGSIGRYWFEQWVSRPDLHIAFSDPMGDDRARFLDWARASWTSDGRSPFLRALDDGHGEVWHDRGRSPGVDVIGYVAADSGLGDFTRRLHRSLVEAGTPTGALDYHRSASPRAADVPALTTDVAHDTNLITVHTDQMPYFADDHGDVVFPGRTNIGYWFWELSTLTPRLIDNIDYVDEVWVATEFVADAFRRVTDKPVRIVPVPVPEPRRSDATRADLGLPDDRFVFLTTFDHLSITDRKNPMAAIRAFERAFPEPDPAGPVLVVKTLNARLRWQEHEELQLAAARLDHVTVVDRHLDRADQMRLIELADCLVSLHRSEGLGLHLQEAMWVGTPLVATRYSGNLDFMHDDNSVLVDAQLVPVHDAQGYYPTDAVWADPDVEQAAAEMARLVADPERCATLAARAQQDMREQPTLAETGELVTAMCAEARSRTTSRGAS